MRLQSQSFIVVLLLLLSACKSYDDRAFFDFPVKEVQDVQPSGSLVPELCFGPVEDVVLGMQIVDSLMLIKTDASDSMYVLRNLHTGETVGKYITRGRGPNEFLSTLGDFDFDGRYADLYDLYSGRYSRVDFEETVFTGYTVISESVKLGSGSLAPFTHVHRVLGKKTLVFDSANSPISEELVSIPKFLLFDEQGNQETEFSCFNNIAFFFDNRKEVLPPC